ncbi:MAG: hypothetical protein KZQ99_22960 [Candidatus Thiodiazotropha sp. (ex Dulcina madagascariensis)]|nr:hypothetical protein [Candidatus Thiodiazotropha sp. (ex Dulcina madagascariensis)]
MKKLLTASVIAASLAASSVTAAPRVAQDDLDRIFANQGAMTQVAALSNSEMTETEGGIVPAYVAWQLGLYGTQAASYYMQYGAGITAVANILANYHRWCMSPNNWSGC